MIYVPHFKINIPILLVAYQDKDPNMILIVIHITLNGRNDQILVIQIIIKQLFPTIHLASLIRGHPSNTNLGHNNLNNLKVSLYRYK